MSNNCVERKLRLFFITSTPPIPSWGGAMAFYRHFVDRNDFDIYVATDNTQIHDYTPKYPYTVIESPIWLNRLCRTRISMVAHSIQHLLPGNFIPDSVKRAVEIFRPDVIFTVAGSWSWTALMAARVASRYKLPLVASFNDWFDYNIIAHPWLLPFHERMFFWLYRRADLSLCTSEGMMEALGCHPNVHTFYPSGAKLELNSSIKPIKSYSDNSFVVAFAGNLGEWYGKMIERLISQCWKMNLPLSFRIFGSNPSWSDKFGQKLREQKVYRGQVSFEILQEEIAEADALLLPMGFEPSSAQIESTSFKTKFLDYLFFQKPIVVWGPDYCSAVRVAKEFQSAQICVSPDEEECLRQIQSLANRPDRQLELVRNARKMYEDRFHPDRIHSLLVKQCQRLMLDVVK